MTFLDTKNKHQVITTQTNTTNNLAFMLESKKNKSKLKTKIINQEKLPSQTSTNVTWYTSIVSLLLKVNILIASVAFAVSLITAYYL